MHSRLAMRRNKARQEMIGCRLLRIWTACPHGDALTVSVTAVSAKGRLPVVVEVLKSLYEKKKQ